MPKFRPYYMGLYKDGGKRDNLTLAQQSLLKLHRRLGHINFWSIIRFTRLVFISSALTTIREEKIYVQHVVLEKEYWTTYNTDGSGTGITDENDQPGMCISIDKIEFTQGGLIPVLKGKQTNKNYHAATIFVDNVSK